MTKDSHRASAFLCLGVLLSEIDCCVQLLHLKYINTNITSNTYLASAVFMTAMTTRVALARFMGGWGRRFFML